MTRRVHAARVVDGPERLPCSRPSITFLHQAPLTQISNSALLVYFPPLPPSPSSPRNLVRAMIRADAYTPDVWESLCTPMHEILPASPTSGSGALFLGSWTAAVDTDLLARHAVHAIVECHDAPWGSASSLSSPSSHYSTPASPTFSRTPTTSPTLASGRPPLGRSASTYQGQGHGAGDGGQIGRFKVAIADSAAPDLLAPHLDGAVRFIRDRLNRGENVLVHCQQGISRSPAIVCAYLMRERALSYDAALQLVKSRRKCSKPNAGFEKTLRSWK